MSKAMQTMRKDLKLDCGDVNPTLPLELWEMIISLALDCRNWPSVIFKLMSTNTSFDRLLAKHEMDYVSRELLQNKEYAQRLRIVSGITSCDLLRKSIECKEKELYNNYTCYFTGLGESIRPTEDDGTIHAQYVLRMPIFKTNIIKMREVDTLSVPMKIIVTLMPGLMKIAHMREEMYNKNRLRRKETIRALKEKGEYV